LIGIVSPDGYKESNTQIQESQENLHQQYAGKVLAQQVVILSYVPVIEVSNTKIKQNVEKK